MGEVLGTVVSFTATYWETAFAVVGALSIIAAKTPNTNDDRIIQGILDAINFLGQNWGRAKNSDSA